MMLLSSPCKDLLIGNPKKAEEKLQWKRKVTFRVCLSRFVYCILNYSFKIGIS